MHVLCLAQAVSCSKSDVACRLAWGIHIGPQHVLEMESVNPNKFSRHVVIWLPNAAFQSGPDLGRFVKDAVLQHKAAHILQVNAGHSRVPIVDTSVYSRCAPQALLLLRSGGTLKATGEQMPGFGMQE
jgi:hypothetical protein